MEFCLKEASTPLQFPPVHVKEILSLVFFYGNKCEIVLPVNQPNSNLQRESTLPGDSRKSLSIQNKLTTHLRHPISITNYIAYVLCI